ncbi:MAG: hypothetical protein KA314_02990 [Chloroflexi bacterium]|nr:hypothetical protein [Chloroflexota bacterium]MBP8054776.1 hypothetical protein [Chloroflexota bacterium]
MTQQDLHLALLGRPIIRLGDLTLRELIPQKIQALLCYLAMNPGEHERESLAELLWGGDDKTADQVRTSLRTDLTRTRNRLAGFLLVNRQTILFNRASIYWLDVEAFKEYLGRPPLGNQTKPAALLNKEEVEQLKRGIALYRGQFLEGFLLREAPGFEGWMRLQQARLEIMAFAALNQLISYALAHRLYQDGVIYGQQLLSLEPTREESHRELMRLLALSGQRSAALEQFEKCRLILLADELSPGLETVSLAQQIRDDLLRPQPTPSPLIPIQQPAPFQPPPDPAHFVNRENLLRQLKTAIATGSNQRLAIVGMGGMGKTSLVIHLAHQIRDQFTDGVLWADVSRDDPIGLIDHWAEAYGCDFRTVADEVSRAAALRDILKDKKALLILDDVDHLTKVRSLIPENFAGTILLTTRDEDIAFHLQAQKFHLDELAEADGLALLRRVVGEERVQAEIAAAQQLCALLQNLPLALNIAAQRLALRHQMHLRDIVARLQREKSRLTALDEIEQAVRASFLVSWRALDDKQKRTFALSGLFAGRTFTTEALTAITEGDPYETEDHLFALNALSLVALTANSRYRQHTLLAEFAREQLGDTQSNQRLATYYLTFAQTNRQVYEALRPEWENLMAGMKLAYEHEMWSVVLGYSEALTEAWFARGRYTEAREGYEWAVAAAEMLHVPAQQANALLHWGRACLEQGDNTEARTLLQQSLHLYQTITDKVGLAQCQVWLAHAYLERITDKQDFATVIHLLQSSQTIYQQLSYPAHEAEAIQGQARAHYFMADYAQARALAEQALDKQRLCHNKHGELITLRLLSQIALAPELSNRHLSATYRWQALTLSENLQDQGEIAVSLGMVAEIHLEQGHLDEAMALLTQSLAILQRIGARRNIALNLSRQSIVQEKRNQPKTALRLGLESLTLCQSLQDPILTASLQIQVGDLYWQMNDPAQARAHWQQGLHLVQPLQHQGYLETFRQRLSR